MAGKPDVEFIHSLDLDDFRGAFGWLAGAYPEQFKEVRRMVEDTRRRRAERAEVRRSLHEDAYLAGIEQERQERYEEQRSQDWD